MSLKRLIALAIITGFSILILPPKTIAQEASAAESPYKAQLLETRVSLEFNNASLAEGLLFLKVKGKELDPLHKGVIFAIEPDASSTALPITLALTDVPLGVALKYVCQLANVRAEMREDAIHLFASAKNTIDVMDPHFVPTSINAYQDQMHKLKSLIIDKVNFDHLDIATAVEFLAQKSKEADPNKQGINFVLGSIGPQDHIHREISLQLENVPLIDVLNAIAEQTNLKCSPEDWAVYFKP